MNRTSTFVVIAMLFCTSVFAQEKPAVPGKPAVSEVIRRVVIDAKTIPDVSKEPWVKKEAGYYTVLTSAKFSEMWQFMNTVKFPTATYYNPVDKIQLTVVACPESEKPDSEVSDCMLWFGDDTVKRWAVKLDTEDGMGKWSLAKNVHNPDVKYSSPELYELIYHKTPTDRLVAMVSVMLETEDGFDEKVIITTASSYFQ